MDYCDLVLILIPLVLLSVTGIFASAGVALSIAVPIAGTITAGIIGHAMFVNEPVAAGRTLTG